MGGAWIIEDDYRINRCKIELLSNQWIHNTVIAAEAITMLDLVTTVVRNVGVNESGKLKVFTNCKIVRDLLTSERIKAS